MQSGQYLFRQAHVASDTTIACQNQLQWLLFFQHTSGNSLHIYSYFSVGSDVTGEKKKQQSIVYFSRQWTVSATSLVYEIEHKKVCKKRSSVLFKPMLSRV